MICVLLEVMLSYRRYAAVPKWTTLSLFTYVAVVVVSPGVPWRQALTALVLPQMRWDASHTTALVAILGNDDQPLSLLLAGRPGGSRNNGDTTPSRCA